MSDYIHITSLFCKYKWRQRERCKGGVRRHRSLPTHPCSLVHVLSVLQCGAAYEIQVQEWMACVFSVPAVLQCESCASVDLINRQGLLAFQFKKLRMGAASLAILSRRSMTRSTMTCMASIEMTHTSMEKLRSGHRRNLAMVHQCTIGSS